MSITPLIETCQLAPKFFVLATPRSGTAWLANFLNTGPVRCRHEMLSEYVTLEGVAMALEAEYFTEGTATAGTVDTLASLLVEPLRERFPEAQWVILQRDTVEVARSLHRLGLDGTSMAVRAAHYLAEARLALPGALWLDYRDLHREQPMRRLWEHIGGGSDFPCERWDTLREHTVQIRDFPQWLKARSPNIQALVRSTVEVPA